MHFTNILFALLQMTSVQTVSIRSTGKVSWYKHKNERSVSSKFLPDIIQHIEVVGHGISKYKSGQKSEGLTRQQCETQFRKNLLPFSKHIEDYPNTLLQHSIRAMRSAADMPEFTSTVNPFLKNPSFWSDEFYLQQGQAVIVVLAVMKKGTPEQFQEVADIVLPSFYDFGSNIFLWRRWSDDPNLMQILISFNPRVALKCLYEESKKNVYTELECKPFHSQHALQFIKIARVQFKMFEMKDLMAEEQTWSYLQKYAKVCNQKLPSFYEHTEIVFKVNAMFRYRPNHKVLDLEYCIRDAFAPLTPNMNYQMLFEETERQTTVERCLKFMKNECEKDCWYLVLLFRSMVTTFRADITPSLLKLAHQLPKKNKKIIFDILCQFRLRDVLQNSEAMYGILKEESTIQTPSNEEPLDAYETPPKEIPVSEECLRFVDAPLIPRLKRKPLFSTFLDRRAGVANIYSPDLDPKIYTTFKTDILKMREESLTELLQKYACKLNYLVKRKQSLQNVIFNDPIDRLTSAGLSKVKQLQILLNRSLIEIQATLSDFTEL